MRLVDPVGLSDFLYLSHNWLTTLPKTLGKLMQLACLNLSDNQLIALHDSIGAMKGCSSCAFITISLRACRIPFAH